MSLRSLVLVVLIIGGAALGPVAAQNLLVTNARVITMAGDDLPQGNVLIKDGKVVAVGVDVSAPGVPTLDAKGKVVMPGFVLADTQGGLSRPNEMMPITPYVSVLDAIDAGKPFFEDSLRDGHLTLCIMPGDRAAIAGVGRVVRPWGLTVESMTIDKDPGMRMSMAPTAGNRAAWIARIRASFEDARRHLEKKKRGEQKPGEKTGTLTLDLKAMGVEKRRVAMSRMLEGELQAWVNCATAGDVVQALRLAKEFGLKMKLVLGPGTWRAADLVKKSGLPVILKASVILRETDPDSGKEVERNLAKILHDKGVKFAITTDTTTFGRRYLWYQAACLVRYGLPRQDALAAITTTPAKIIGLGDRKGSLAKDKDGDLLVFTSDPLSGRAWVDQAVIGGRIVYERKNDPRLAEIFGNGAK